MNYSLLKEKWIPVLWKDGNVNRVGIIEALTQASRIRQIAASNPMNRVAILRFLLALLYWCKGNPPDNIPDGSFPPDWFTKLDDNKGCFDLLGKEKRFYQYNKPSGGKNGKLTANYLVHEVPTGTNLWHFRHSTDNMNGLCPACCAMGLLRLPVFATSGGRGKPPGINAKPPIYVVPLGTSLLDTLLLSWRNVSDSNLGTPSWEKPNLQLPETGVVPLLTGLTWLPRRVWLDKPEQDEDKSCISCGRKGCLVTSTVFAPIGSQKTERVWRDPHIICDGEDIVKPSDALGASDAAAGQWAKIMAGIIEGQKDNNTRRRVWVVGFATVKNDKYLEAMEYEIPCAQVKIQESIEKIEKWQKEGKSLAKNMGPLGKKTSSRKHVEMTSLIASIRPQVEERVSANAGELLVGDDNAWEQAASEYSPMTEVIARSLSPGFTTAAVERRKQIASMKPNMKQKTDAAKKHNRKKGGNK